ncbi:MAG: hypothetical protein J5984_02640 [Clostridia bacterium]|nr:hypothetical protein [Clostridia bacterium]
MRRKCAVCGDTNQTNVRLKWQRHSDSKVFHVCCACAEANRVNADSVQEKVTKTYTTVDSEYVASTDTGTLRQRPALSTGARGRIARIRK